MTVIARIRVIFKVYLRKRWKRIHRVPLGVTFAYNFRGITS